MTATYILIWVVFQTRALAIATHSQEFTSMESCSLAAEAIEELAKEDGRKAWVICVPK